ncbi:hypothetical protein K2173_011189 [Erythroxylum novogranatense]|uniref:DC1 domain-containing protein n=1 Tax=Erythroxylum novogranatense TaxID=1862640 RepID=A0AAV8U4S9_9ROSI|nr:hypothetical protein K2173_011189 [Erythroxylum novogranatense]
MIDRNDHFLISEIVKKISKILEKSTVFNGDRQLGNKLELLDHFLHKHELLFADMEDHDSVTCAGCKKQVLGRYYACFDCKFSLHESCTNIPMEIYHFTHSCPLILIISNTRTCEACGEPCRGFLYDCGRCSWGVHYSCTLKQLPNTITNPEAQEQIESPLHRHPLSTVEKMREDNGVLCEVCGELCFGPTYYECSVCSFMYTSRVEIPKQLYSFYHKCRYFLALLICRSYECGACTRAGFGVSYACISCGFRLHLKCALRLPGNFEGLPHICHNLMKKTDCLSCKFPLEKPCSEHMLEVQSPLHPEHTLFLYKSPDICRCNVCLGDCPSGFFFRCDKCDFYCGFECIYLIPTIQFANHGHHLLTVVDRVYDDVECDTCQKSCKGKPAFRCLECKFNLHLLCGPLPHTIKHEHIHSLTFEDYIIDDKDEQYCYHCEEIRDPLLCVYYCKGCSYTAEVDCVMSEYNNMHGYSDEEYIEEESSGSYNDQSSEECSQSGEECSGNERRGHDLNIPEVSPYSEKAFTQFVQKLDSSTGSRKKLKLVLSDDEKQLVRYGKYITPRIFIPILKGLINGKHGDISSESMLDPRIKSICFIYLSEVIYSMRTIKVLNIKRDMIHTWWNRTKMLELMGFKVDFIQDRLMVVARAYFGLKARNFANKTSDKQVSEIEQLRKNIKILMARVEELEVEHRNHLEYVKSATTPLMVKCFSDAEAMKWRPAADGLL